MDILGPEIALLKERVLEYQRNQQEKLRIEENKSKFSEIQLIFNRAVRVHRGSRKNVLAQL